MDATKSRLSSLYALIRKVTAIEGRKLVAFDKLRVFHICLLCLFSVGTLSGFLRHFGL